METKNRLYRGERPDRFKTFLRRSGRSNGNQAKGAAHNAREIYFDRSQFNTMN